VPITRRSHPERARAHGGIHGTLSLCAPSDVRCFYSPNGRLNALARVLVWAALWIDLGRRFGIQSSAGGARITRRTSRLRRVYVTGEIPPHSVYLVAKIPYLIFEPLADRGLER